MSVLPKAVTHNLSLKVLAFVGAWILWAIVPAESSTQRETISAIPVRVQVGDADWSLASDPVPGEVSVRFSGPTRDVIQLVRQGTSVRVPIDRVVGPDSVVQLRRDWVVVPSSSGLVVEEIIPATLDLAFERALSVRLPLRLVTVGELDPGLSFAAALGVTPPAVQVRGPARLLEAIDSVPLEPLDLAEISRSGIISVPVDTAGLGGILVGRTTADVGVRVEPTLERLLPAIPISLPEGAPESVQVEPATVPVRVRGANSILSGSAMAGLRVEVEPRDLGRLRGGESGFAALRIDGVPNFVVAELTVDSVRVIRP